MVDTWGTLARSDSWANYSGRRTAHPRRGAGKVEDKVRFTRLGAGRALPFGARELTPVWVPGVAPVWSWELPRRLEREESKEMDAVPLQA